MSIIAFTSGYSLIRRDKKNCTVFVIRTSPLDISGGNKIILVISGPQVLQEVPLSHAELIIEMKIDYGLHTLLNFS